MADTADAYERAAAKQPLHRLLGNAMRQSADLVQLEIALFKEEMTENISRLFIGLGLMVTGAVFAISGLLLLVQAFVAWLATVVGSAALAALITGGVLLIVAIAVMLAGRSMMSITPTRSIRSVSRDAHMFSDKVTS